VRLALALAAALAAAPASAGDEPEAKAEPAPDRALVVAIDPGHGGPHPHAGARGPRKLYEKTVALAVAQKLGAFLEAEGATAVLTREEDVELPLSARAHIANEADADVFLSIHCNSMATAEGRQQAQGVETYFLSPDPTDAEARLLAELENGGPAAMPVTRQSDPVKGLLDDLSLGQARNDSARLAEFVQRQMVRTLRAQGRGVRQAPFLVLSALKMPAVLVEVGFISHPQEGRKLARDGYQERIAKALAQGVLQFADAVLQKRLVAAGERPKQAAPAPVKPPRSVAGLPGSR